jgi:hypothetical protein
MSSVKEVNEIPTEGKQLIVVAAVDRVLHFRIFDGEGKVVLDTDEKRLTQQVGRIEDLRKQLESLWPPHELAGSEKDRVVTAVTSILSHTPETLALYLADLRRQKEDYADRWLNYYNNWRIRIPHVLFRTMGTFVIIGSISLPYLAQTTNEKNKWVISLVSLGVALLTALISFFNWNLTWQRRVAVTVALKHHIACWKIDMLKASKEDYDYAKQQAYNATSHLFTMVFATVSAESQAFFAELKPPPTPPKQPGGPS